MKKFFVLLIFSLFIVSAKAQTLYFPPATGNTWDTISPASLGWCQDKIDTLIDYLGNRNTKAFIILKDGKIVVEHYFGTFTADSGWYWASAGKSLTSFTVGLAQQDGFLSINDTSSQYLGAGWTACPSAKENLITIRNQLTMTSGLDDGVPDSDCTLDTCLQYLADAGSRWAYHNAPYTLLDSVIFYSTGQTLNSYVAQKVLIPTGMTGLYFQSGYNNVFYSKPRSMARYGLLILNKGNWNGNQIMTDTTYFNQMVNTSQALNLSYGYLWWLNGKASFMLPSLQIVFPGPLNPSAPNDMFAAMGKNGQLLNIVPGMNLVFVRMGDSPGGAGAVSPSFNDTIWQKLNDVFCSSTSVSTTTETKQLNIFPNPAQQSFTLELPGQHYDVIISDVKGRKMFEQKNNFSKIKINCTDFPKGIYFLQAGNGKNIYNRKLIIE
jgi:CubicO group peptidase (beta-lactamase class C family)